MGQAGFGDGHGEGAEQRIGQRHGGATTQALVESCQRAFDTEAADQTAGQCAKDQRDHHVDPAQAEHQHQADGDEYRIHGIDSRFRDRLRRKARTVPKAAWAVKAIPAAAIAALARL